MCQLEETKPGTGESKSKFIVSMHTKPPSPNQKFSATNMWIDTKPQQMVQFCNNICSLNNNMTVKRSSAGFWESGMLNISFLPKLNKISQSSDAPLPYVNLDKYDAGDDRPHIPMSSNGSAENLLETNVNCSNYDNLSPEFGHTRLKLDYQNNSLLNLNENINQIDNVRNKDLNHENSPPPKLPPKGPVLQNKNSQRHFTSSLEACSTSPILKTSRRHTMSPDSSSSSDLSPYHVPKISHPLVARIRDHDIRDPTEPYLLMSGFSKEEKNDIGVASGYMDMTGKFEIPSSQPPPACLPVQPIAPYTPEMSPMNQCPPPPPLNTMPNEMWPQPTHSGHYEENYMEMGGSSKCPLTKHLQTLHPVVSAGNNNDLCVSQSREMKTDSSTNDCNPVPFPNLKNLQSLNPEKSAESSLNSSPTKPACKEKSQENAGKSPGFFSRLIRRNSKDHTKNSQSQENLSASSCSLERSNSIQDNICPVNNVEVAGNSESVPLECPHLSIERQRSSSFPSESCFHDMIPEGPKCKAAHNLSGYKPTGYSSFSTINRCSQPISTLPLPDSCNSVCSCQSGIKKKSNLLNNTHYLECHSPPNDSPLDIPCENNCNIRLANTKPCELSESDGYQKEFSDSYIYMGPLYKEEKLKAEKIDEPSCESVTQDKTINIHHVQDDFMVQFRGKDSSKTDDEKLFELYQSCKSKHKEDEEMGSPVDFPIGELKEKFSLSLNKPISPDEQAAAIARHVADLPPFIPPKTKTYPCSLSPVFESNSFLLADAGGPVEQKCEKELNLNQTEVLQPPFKLKDLSDYVQQKQQVQSSLRIAPASDATHDTVWVLRDAESAGNVYS